MPLRPTTVRFDELGQALVRGAAQTLGVTVGQFVREASIIRAVLVSIEEPPMSGAERLEAMRELSEQVRRLASIDDDDG